MEGPLHRKIFVNLQPALPLPASCPFWVNTIYLIFLLVTCGCFGNDDNHDNHKEHDTIKI
jgi:hypothetical protein